jgi:ADP-ribosylglycohydrolase
MAHLQRDDEGPEAHRRRLERAEASLHGLAVGDALGGFFEFAGANARRRIAERWLPGAPWRWTDDTQMAGAVVATLRQSAGVDQDVLAAELAARYERGRGYGMATRAVLSRLRRGADWRMEAPGLFGGKGSFGNGAASRVPPIGAYFADDLRAAAEHAARSAVVTHAHPEAVAGAVAVAVTATLVWQLRERPLSRAELLGRVIALVPASAVREGLEAARDLPPETTAPEAAKRLGSGTMVSCQDTVPFALWCAATPHTSFEETIWQTLGGLGDCDTTCAIVGGISALRTGVEGIPERWRQSCEPHPEYFGGLLNPRSPAS